MAFKSRFGVRKSANFNQNGNSTFGEEDPSRLTADSGLSMQGFRIGAIDDPKKNAHDREQDSLKTYKSLAYKNYKDDPVFIKKDRTGFGGGFKIPEEYRLNKQKRQARKKDEKENDETEDKDQNLITKDEVMAHLNLHNNESGALAGKYGNNSKSALTKDLIEGLEKELEKLRRNEEIIKYRKAGMMKGGTAKMDETEEDRLGQLNDEIGDQIEAEGGYYLNQDEKYKYIQAFRHKAGQLDSLKNLDLDELDQTLNALRGEAYELETVIYGKKENQQIGGMIRKKMGYEDSAQEFNELDDNTGFGKNEGYQFGAKAGGVTSTRSKKSVKISEGISGHVGKSSGKSILKQSAMMTRDTDDDRASRSRSGGKQGFKSDLMNKFTGAIREEVDHDQFVNETPFDSDLANQMSSGIREYSQQMISSQYNEGTSVAAITAKARIRSRSRTRDRMTEEEIRLRQNSPRRQIYEAKFDKYIANKEQKTNITNRAKAMAKEHFDITTRDMQSPSRFSSRFGLDTLPGRGGARSSKYDPEELMPEGYENHLMREELVKKTQQDPFKLLGVSNDDKMAFFLLKWVFNAIKRESDKEDSELKGNEYVTKAELYKQLVKNKELMGALDFTEVKDLQREVRAYRSAKQGTMMWEEFLDFFFGRHIVEAERKDGKEWYNRLEQDGNKLKSEQNSPDSQARRTDQSVVSYNSRSSADYGSSSKRRGGRSRLLQEIEEVEMTPALKALIETRRVKTEQEVEVDFKTMQVRKEAEREAGIIPAGKKKKATFGVSFETHQGALIDEETMNEQLGFGREKAQCLLLPSQIQTMKELFERLDKYKDHILKRSDLLMALRTDEKIVDFIDVDAVKVAALKDKILTLDQVLTEIERDETYEMMQMSKQDQPINHKEFITWREFLTYFEDFREIEERNKKSKQLAQTRESLKKLKGQQTEEVDPEEEMKSLMETEKERRLKDLPKLRPADQIDITSDQLELIHRIYEKQPKVGDAVNAVTFFMAVRKHPEIRKISSAIARDPEGTSRLHKESFQQVFDRMEKDTQQKTIEWAVIVEYFTKRGRPLNKEEIQKLQDEDRRLREEEEEEKRRAEEDERRRMARIMEKVDEDLGGYDDDKRHKHDERDEEEPYDDYDDMDSINSGDEFDDEMFDRANPDDGYRGSRKSQRVREMQRSTVEHIEDDDYERHLERQASTGMISSLKGNIRKAQTRQDALNESLMAKKGRYGITVPKPFAFDIREKVRPKSIRERKIEEMIAEKRLDEERKITHTFRSKPIPPEVLIPRYQSIIDKNEERRLKVKQDSIQITKIREAPFSFWERDKHKRNRTMDPDAGTNDECKRPPFKANRIPIACSVLIYDQKIKKEKEERDIRIQKANEISSARIKMPPRMQKDHDRKMQQSPKQKPEEFSFQPKINELKTGEHFKKLQKKFEESLLKKKSQMTVTRPKSPNFRQTKSKALERAYVNEGEPVSKLAQTQKAQEDKFKATLAKQRSMKSANAGPAKQPSSTRAVELAQKRRREEIEAKKKASEDQLKDDEKRNERQSRMKGAVQSMLVGRIKDSSAQIKATIESNREAQRKQEKDKKEEIAERIQKGRERPMLIDSYQGKARSNLAKIKNTKKFVEQMQESGMGEKKIQSLLSEEERELIEEDKYIQAQKKKYGRP